MASCPRCTGSKLPRMHASCVEEGEEEVNKEEPVSQASRHAKNPVMWLEEEAEHPSSPAVSARTG